MVFYLVCEAIGTAATPGLLCQPRVIVKMIVRKQMECRLAGETEILGENLPQHHFCPSQNPTWPDPGLNPGRRGGKPATNRLSYGAACLSCSFAIPPLFPSLIHIIFKSLILGYRITESCSLTPTCSHTVHSRLVSASCLCRRMAPSCTPSVCRTKCLSRNCWYFKIFAI
jgi:hypothetical protein